MHNYTYDAEGRISSVDGAASYVYDAEGRRVAKKNAGGAVTASYVLGPGGEQMTEMNGSGQWMHSNLYANGALLATYDSQGTRFQLTDAQGSRRVQADVDGTVGLTCFNYPYGDGLSCSGGNEDATEHHFTGKERDSESGLDNFGARYLASSLGRFMTPDWAARPATVPYAVFGDPQSLNLYNYVRNDPISLTDAEGHCIADASGLGCVDASSTSQTKPQSKESNRAQNKKPLTPAKIKRAFYKQHGKDFNAAVQKVFGKDASKSRNANASELAEPRHEQNSRRPPQHGKG